MPTKTYLCGATPTIVGKMPRKRPRTPSVFMICLQQMKQETYLTFTEAYSPPVVASKEMNIKV